MRIPRDMDGGRLGKALFKFGYVQTRQAGSHMRVTTEMNGQHHITIPAHNPLRVGTLNEILSDVAAHMKMTKAELLEALFR